MSAARLASQQARQKISRDETPHCLGDGEWLVAPDEIRHLEGGESMSARAQRWHAKYAPRIPVDPEIVRVS